MVKQFLFVLLLVGLHSSAAHAAEFSATVDNTTVVAGQPFALQLSLTGARVKVPPDISALKNLFTLLGQAETSSYNYVNGTMSSDVGVQLTMVARQEGHLTIPSLSVETDKGTLRTEPIELDVRSAAPIRANPSMVGGDGSPVSITATAEPRDPYQGQPIRYQILVTCFSSVSNITLDDITVENAVLEKPTQPIIRDVVTGGRAAKMLEYDFVLTPLKSGPLTVPPPSFHGTVMGDVQIPDPMNTGFSSFIQMFQNLGAHPFSVQGPEVSIDVRPPAAEMNPWLPLYTLKIQDEWRGIQDAKVGEPLTRKITMYAEGMAGSQLPDVEVNENHTEFKVYADKPSVGTDNGKPGEHVQGWRRESYTLIPQKAGTLTLPAVHIAWWDLTNGRVASADIPEKTILVAAGVQTAVPAPVVAPVAATTSAPQPDTETSPVVEKAVASSSRPLMIATGIFLIVLLPLIAWALSLHKKMKVLQEAAHKPKAPPPRPVSAPNELAKVENADELRTFLQVLAASRWGTSVNLPLEKILPSVPTALKADFEKVVKNLTAALYAGRTVDIRALKQLVEQIDAWKPQKTPNAKTTTKLQDLNPN